MAYRRNAASNRDALFGNAASAPKVSNLNKKPAARSTTTTSSTSTTTASRTSKKPLTRTLTGQAKIEKMKEAEEYRTKAKKALQRGLFASPDPIAGGMFYHRAAEAYKLCGENRLERLHRIASADCQQGHGAYATAAQEYMKAAELSKDSEEETLERKRAECTKLYADAAKAWKEENELGRAGECMLLSGFSLLMTDEEIIGGQYLEQMKSDAMTIVEAAVESYVPDPLNLYRKFRQTGVSSFVDQDAVPSEYQGDWEPDEATLNLCKNHMVKSSFAHESLAKAIHKFVEYGEYKSALYTAGAVTAILEADGFSTITLSRAYCAETVLMLAQGDVVAADKQFLEVHLQNNNYLSSRECKLAEDLIRAIKSRDPDELDVARDPNGSNRAALANLDTTLRNLVAFLKISGAAKKKAIVSTGGPVAVGGNNPSASTSQGGYQLQNELDDLMNGMGLGSDEVEDDDDDDDLDLR